MYFKTDFYAGKVPRLQIQKSPEIYNNVVDVINRNEAHVQTTWMLKQVTQCSMNESRRNMKATSNNVPEIIEDNEDAVGRPYERYGGYPGYKYKAETGNNDKNSCACSRSSSKASRKGAFFY